MEHVGERAGRFVRYRSPGMARVPTNEGKFTVVAGGRRLAALKMLAKSGSIAKDYPVPCNVVAEGQAVETSLAENIHRVAMDPLEECEAFSALRAQNIEADDIARRFGVTGVEVRRVDDRPAIAA